MSQVSHFSPAVCKSVREALFCILRHRVQSAKTLTNTKLSARFIELKKLVGSSSYRLLLQFVHYKLYVFFLFPQYLSHSTPCV